jgi:hypothetical protein
LTTLQDHFDAVATKFRLVVDGLREAADQETAGQARPDLQRACRSAIPTMQRTLAALYLQLVMNAPTPAVAATLLEFDRDVTALLLVLRGDLRITAPGEEPN